MLDIGGWEFLLVLVLGIIIFRPRDLPRVIQTWSGLMRRVRHNVREFQSGLEEVAREAEFDKVSDSVKTIGEPIGSVGKEIMDVLDREDDLTDLGRLNKDSAEEHFVDYDVSNFIEENEIRVPENLKKVKDNPANREENDDPEKAV
ncbi:MAG: Sec-independent protein translocase protein TatB [Alphaproteobacteria bacterium MarineAlpha11_Bin1]|nr:MAG: Sec-independent protein translocase protein TatB [Alphaproteobacteria bacterium MarineAlpha11_Bin1]|tara:strand:+ start:542 stop:979 length:438 start_codon:yes stop_codon:yes gene_type:complete